MFYILDIFRHIQRKIVRAIHKVDKATNYECSRKCTLRCLPECVKTGLYWMHLTHWCRVRHMGFSKLVHPDRDCPIPDIGVIIKMKLQIHCYHNIPMYLQFHTSGAFCSPEPYFRKLDWTRCIWNPFYLFSQIADSTWVFQALWLVILELFGVAN